MDESIVSHENEQIMNSEECSELDTTSTAMMFSNGHHVITTMDTMDKEYSIYCYFSSAYEVANCLWLYFSYACMSITPCSCADIIAITS